MSITILFLIDAHCLTDVHPFFRGENMHNINFFCECVLSNAKNMVTLYSATLLLLSDEK